MRQGQSDDALYELLGVAVTATESEISRSYRRLALRYHPDRNPDGTEQFKALSNAYAVLSDPEKRALYDATGRVEGSGSGDEPVSTAERSAELEAQVRAFFKNYAGSTEEKDDAVKTYQLCDGNFRKMVREHLLFDNGVDGEVKRLLQLVRSLIAAGRLTATPMFEKTTTPEQVRKLEKTMAKEKQEAEEALKEMGLGGNGSGGGEGELGALQALIQQRQRQSHEALLDDMEKRYCHKTKDARGGGTKKRARSPAQEIPEKKHKRHKH